MHSLYNTVTQTLKEIKITLTFYKVLTGEEHRLLWMNFALKSKPKGDNKVSSSELLSILKHRREYFRNAIFYRILATSTDVNDGINSRHSSGKDSLDGSCLEGEFSKLFLNNYEMPGAKPTSVIHRPMKSNLWLG